MLIVKTPTRLTLWGSSTDYSCYFREYSGVSVNCTINKYIYICLKKLPPMFDYKSKFSYSIVEEVKDHSEIKHRVIREALKLLNINDGIELSHLSDIFARAGLGASSSFCVSLINAFSAYKEKYLDKLSLAKLAIHLEQNILKETVGLQDSIAASYGSLNHIVYHRNGEFSVNPIYLSGDFFEYFQSHFMLFFTGISRTANNIASKYVNKLNDRVVSQQQFVDVAYDGLEHLQRENIYEVGQALNKTWEIKRELSKEISNSQIDQMYEKTKDIILGFKLMGAGGGGSIFLLVEPKHQQEVRNRLGLVEIPVKISQDGSKIIHMERN